MARTRKRRSGITSPSSINSSAASESLRKACDNSTKVYSFRDVAACAKLLGFRGVLQFTEGLRIVICLPAMRSGRARGGRTFTSQGTNEKRQQVETARIRAVERANQNEEVSCLGIQNGPRSSTRRLPPTPSAAAFSPG